MPAKNPRLTITLKPALGAQLRRLSELTGNSQSALIAELLDGTTPVFERLITVLEAAQAAKGELRGSVAHELDAAQAKLEAQLGLAFDTMDDGFRPILEASEMVRRRAAGAGGARRSGLVPSTNKSETAAEAQPTPMSNRGVRSTRRGVRGAV